MHTKVLYFLNISFTMEDLHDFLEKCVKKNRAVVQLGLIYYCIPYYFLVTATSFILALISIEMEERSILSLPDIVSITIVFSANSAILP